MISVGWTLENESEVDLERTALQTSGLDSRHLDRHAGSRRVRNHGGVGGNAAIIIFVLGELEAAVSARDLAKQGAIRYTESKIAECDGVGDTRGLASLYNFLHRVVHSKKKND